MGNGECKMQNAKRTIENGRNTDGHGRTRTDTDGVGGVDGMDGEDGEDGVNGECKMQNAKRTIENGRKMDGHGPGKGNAKWKTRIGT